MSTEFTVNGELFALRFAGPKGATFQFEVTEDEFDAWADEEVVSFESSYGTAREFLAWVVAEGCEVLWDNAARQNEFARGLENHRFAERFPAMLEMATVYRMRARRLTGASLRVVNP